MPAGLEWLAGLPLGAVAGIAVMWADNQRTKADVARLMAMYEGMGSIITEVRLALRAIETQVADIRASLTTKG